MPLKTLSVCKNKFNTEFWLNLVLILLVITGLLFATPAKAVSTFYYCDSQGDHDPQNILNYYNDITCSDPAGALPDFDVDIISVIGDVIYDGNAKFRGNAVNQGEVTGDAIFYEDSSENIGTIGGTKTRYYSNDATILNRNLIGWIVVADGADVTIQAPSNVYDETTTFSEINGGRFIFTIVEEAYVSGNILTLDYSDSLDETSIPDTTDFVLLVDEDPVSISSVNINNDIVSLALADYVYPGSIIKLNYTLGVNPIKRTGNLYAGNLVEEPVIYKIEVGDLSQYPFTFNDKVYVPNYDSGTVSVIDTTTNSLITNINVGNGPTYGNGVGHKVYISNDLDDTISVINTLNNTVIDTISVGDTPRFISVAGTKIYVSNAQDKTISVIDTNNDNVVATITLPAGPMYTTVAGTKLYTANQDSNTVSVIDTVSDTLLTNITVGENPYFIVTMGDRVLTADTDESTVSIIDTNTDAVIETINVAAGAQYGMDLGNRFYVNSLDDKITAINAISGTIASVISTDAGDAPQYILTDGRRIFATASSASKILILDPETLTFSDSVDLPASPFSMTVAGNIFYANNQLQKSLYLFDRDKTTTMLPNLVRFSTENSDGNYTAGQQIQLSAHFGLPLQNGSNMTLLMNNGAEVTLDVVSGKTLSGTYTIGSNEETPDLAVSSIISADITDTLNNSRNSYDLPSSKGDFEAENSFITRNLGDVANITIGPYTQIEVGANPYQISPSIQKNGESYIYVANQGDASVSVIRLSDHSVVDTIDVGLEPYGVAAITISDVVYLYFANTGSDDVSVINTSTNTVTATINVGAKPYYATTVGENIYVTNGLGNSVSVINALTNTVIDTIPVGVYPRGIKAHGNNIYIANYGDQNYDGGNYVSVIDASTNTAVDSIIMPIGVDGPRGLTVFGDRVYTANYRSANVTVIDALTNTVLDIIDVGNGPRGIVGFGNKIYVENFDDGTISIIDTNTNTVVKTIESGHSPSGIAVIGSLIYISRFQDNVVSIINTETNELVLETEETDETDEDSGSTTSSGGGYYSVSSGDITTQPPTQILPQENENTTPPIIPTQTTEISDYSNKGDDYSNTTRPSEPQTNSEPDYSSTSNQKPAYTSTNKNHNTLGDVLGYTAEFIADLFNSVPKKILELISILGLIFSWNVFLALFGCNRKNNQTGIIDDSKKEESNKPGSKRQYCIIFSILFYLGATISIVLLFLSPTILNYVIVGIYTFIILFRIFGIIK